MSGTSNGGGSPPIAPIIGRTLIRAIAGSLLIEFIVLAYTAWFTKRKQLK